MEVVENLSKKSQEIPKDIENPESEIKKSIPQSENSNSQSENLLDKVLDVFIDEEEEKKDDIFPSYTKKILMVLSLLLILFILIFSISNMILKKYIHENSQIYIPQPFSSMNNFYYYKLKNGLKVLHIKIDEEFDTTNLSLSVGVGNYGDFDGYPGLAKILGQSFFDGSVNYEIDEYIKFVAEKFEGSIESMVDNFHTTHHFSIQDDGFEEILEPFMDSLLNPSFNTEFIKKNIIEVNYKNDVEYFSNRNFFNYKLLKFLGKKEAEIFKDGKYLLNINYDIEDLKIQIKKFHEKFYKSNLMSLIIISSQEKEYIKTIIDNNFNKIKPNPDFIDYKDLMAQKYKNHKSVFPFDDEVFNYVYYGYNYIEIPQINLNFVIDSEIDFGKFEPARYFMALFHFLGKDSFHLDLLKSNFVTNLKSEITFQNKNFAILSLTFFMTESAQSNISIIIQKFYLFLKSLENKEVHENYSKLKNYSKLDFFFNIDNESFDFSDKTPLAFYDSCPQFSKTLLFSDPEYIYIRKNFLNNFDKKKWKNFLKSLNLEKSIITISSKDFLVDVKKIKKDIDKEEKSENIMNRELKKDSKNKNRILEEPNESPTMILRNKLIKLGILNKKKKDEEEISPILKTLNKLLIDKKNDQDKEKTDENNTNVIKSFENKILNISTKLERNVDNELSNIISPFFDHKVFKLKLNQNLNFDDELPYEKVPFDKKIIAEFNKVFDTKLKNYYENLKFPNNFLNEYNISNHCKVPEFLKTNTLISEEPKFIFDIEQNNKKFVSKISQPINVKIILDSAQSVLKNKKKDSKYSQKVLKKFIGIRKFKQCLFSEFQIDTKNLILNSILNNDYVKILKKTYRQTFQNKFVTFIEINSNMIRDKLINQSQIDKKLNFSFLVKLFCIYFREHIHSNYSIFILQGNKFSCELKHGLFLIKLESMKNSSQKFAEIVFKELKKSNFDLFYDQYLLANTKEYLMDRYANFKNLNLDQLLEFYMEKLFDKLAIDTSNTSKFQNIKKIISEFDEKTLANFSNNILEGAHITFLYIGDIDANASLLKTKSYVTNLYRGDIDTDTITHPSREDVSKILFRKPNDNTTIFRIENSSTQPELNGYLTFFYLGRGISKKVELYLKVILHFMKINLTESLQEKLNVEKVDIKIVNYYNNFGIQIFFSGNFVPHLIEYDVEKSLLDFTNYIKSKRIGVFKIIAHSILLKMKRTNEDLDQMAHQLYDIYTNQCISNDTFTYDNAIHDFTSVGLIKLVDELFFDSKKNQRIIFELYNENINDEIMNYRLKESLTLDGKKYMVFGKNSVGSKGKALYVFKQALINMYNLPQRK